MGMMDNMKDMAGDKMGDMGDEMKQRLEMLKNKEKSGDLNDSERSELQQLRSRMTNHGQQ